MFLSLFELIEIEKWLLLLILSLNVSGIPWTEEDHGMTLWPYMELHTFVSRWSTRLEEIGVVSALVAVWMKVAKLRSVPRPVGQILSYMWQLSVRKDLMSLIPMDFLIMFCIRWIVDLYYKFLVRAMVIDVPILKYV